MSRKRAARRGRAPLRRSTEPGRFRLPVTIATAIALVAGLTLSGPEPATAATAIAAPGVIATIPTENTPEAEALDPTSHLLYVVGEYEDAVSVIDEAGDADQGKVVGTIPAPFATFVAVDPSNHHLYVTNSSTLFVIGLAGDGGHILSSVPVTEWPTAIAVDPSNHNVYITNLSDQLQVIDESGDVNKGTVRATIAVGCEPEGVAVDSTTHVVYVSNRCDNSVWAIDPTTGTTTTIRVGNQPTSIAVDPGLHKVYVTDFGASAVSVIDESTAAVIAAVGVGGEPGAVAVDPSTHEVYVANIYDSTVSVIDETGNGQKIAKIAVGAYPDAIVIDPSNDDVYVATYFGYSVSVIGPPADVAMTVNGPATAADGSQFSIVVGVTNDGPAPAARTTTNFLVPAGLTVVAAPGAHINAGTLVWPARALAPGASDTYPVTFAVTANLHLTLYLGGVTICSSAYDPVPANNTAFLPIHVDSRSSLG